MAQWRPDVCIYHYPCIDGFTAAWVVDRKWRGYIEFWPYGYDAPPPPLERISKKNVLIVDFSFPVEVLVGMATHAASIVVLDHHKTAKFDLSAFVPVDSGHITANNIGDRIKQLRDNKMPPIVAVFDMDRSGAGITWDFAMEDERPALINYVEDRDL